jgi:L-aspartate oxidase
MGWGAEFDREGGRLLFTREAAHSRPRILHAQGDATGREIVRALLARAGTERNISFLAHAETESLIVRDGRVSGVRYLDPLVRAPRVLRARGVVLATGGAGALYLHTTNPDVATGDGMAMAYRAGAELSDMEFVQFHPTALNLEGAPRFLLSEALRGEGGVLRNAAGRRFMPRYHDAAELAPRDVVTRSIVAEMGRTATRTVFLDMTDFDAAHLRRRFPKIYRTCLRYGLDLAREPIPVSPAAHYVMGGVRTDLEGRTTLAGLYAAGEAACTGVHGANRLASNSLLEGLVFGARAGAAAAEDLKGAAAPPAAWADEATDEAAVAAADVRRVSAAAGAVRKRVRRLMWERVGILRTREGLERALSEFGQIASAPLLGGPRNFVTVASIIARSALWREESRGGHYRLDFTRRDDARWRLHSVIQKEAGLAGAESVEFAAGVER